MPLSRLRPRKQRALDGTPADASTSLSASSLNSRRISMNVGTNTTNPTRRSVVGYSATPTNVGNRSSNPTSQPSSVNKQAVNSKKSATLADLQSGLDQLFLRLSNHMDAKFDELNEKIQDIADDIIILDERISTLEEKSSTDIVNTGQVVNDIRGEIIERERRACNVLILGLTELESTADDLTYVNKLLEELPDAPIVSKCIRIGKIIPNRIRPLKLFLKSNNEVKLLFRDKKFFDSKNLKLVNDSTPLEQKFLFDLRLELNNRIAAGENNLVIRYIRGIPRIVLQKNM